MNRVTIPNEEFKQRVKNAAAKAREWNLDVLVVNGNEADYANTRYFSNFWPVFERCGVAISANGECCLMVGPESEIFAGDVSVISNIKVVYEYRESADPAYPEFKGSTFNEAFKSIGVQGDNIKIGIASFLDTNVIIYNGIKNAYPKAEIVRADKIMVDLRKVKSDNEITCLKEATRITQIATDEVIKSIRPGMTELQLVGIAQQAIYANGAEYEGLPMYCFSQKSTKHAISRSSYKRIEMGDIVQLNLSAKVSGYSPSIGMPISMGKLSGEKKDLVEFGLMIHMWTEKQIKSGVKAKDIAQGYYDLFKKNNYEKNFLYGPCHGLGLIEVEAPWMETTSEYFLEKNMTFQIDSFVMGSDFGLRWEKPIAVGEESAILLGKQIGVIHELEF